jgi:hypothetical protein
MCKTIVVKIKAIQAHVIKPANRRPMLEFSYLCLTHGVCSKDVKVSRMRVATLPVKRFVQIECCVMEVSLFAFGESTKIPSCVDAKASINQIPILHIHDSSD